MQQNMKTMEKHTKREKSSQTVKKCKKESNGENGMQINNNLETNAKCIITYRKHKKVMKLWKRHASTLNM